MKEVEVFIEEPYRKYKCFSLLTELAENNSQFRSDLIMGVISGKIRVFDDAMFELIRNQRIRNIRNFEDVFLHGTNLGYCTVCAKQLSYSLDECYLCGGEVKVLKGTKNAPNGEHTWILYGSYIIDTTLMLFIDEGYAHKFGYNEQNRYNPNMDSIYLATKKYTTDTKLNYVTGATR